MDSLRQYTSYMQPAHLATSTKLPIQVCLPGTTESTTYHSWTTAVGAEIPDLRYWIRVPVHEQIDKGTIPNVSSLQSTRSTLHTAHISTILYHSNGSQPLVQLLRDLFGFGFQLTERQLLCLDLPTGNQLVAAAHDEPATFCPKRLQQGCRISEAVISFRCIPEATDMVVLEQILGALHLLRGWDCRSV